MYQINYDFKMDLAPKQHSETIFEILTLKLNTTRKGYWPSYFFFIVAIPTTPYMCGRTSFILYHSVAIKLKKISNFFQSQEKLTSDIQVNDYLQTRCTSKTRNK